MAYAHSGIEPVATIDSHTVRFAISGNSETMTLQEITIDAKHIWTLEKQLAELKTENRQYRETVSFLLSSLWAALDPMESLISLLCEELRPIKKTVFFLIFRVGDVTNIWIQLSNRELKTEMAVAAVQSKVYRVFPTTNIRFLVVPQNIANLRGLAPRTARVVKIKRN